MTGSGTKCTQGFPYSFNLEKFILDNTASTKNSTSHTSEGYGTYNYESYPHNTVSKIALALGILLVFSVVIGFITMGSAVTQVSGFCELNLLPLILDVVILLACLGLSLAILVYEIGGNYNAPTAAATTITAFIGIGGWLLLAAFFCRLLSNPILFAGFLLLIAVLVLFPLALVIGCCVGMCRSSSSSSSSSSTYYTPRNSTALVVSERDRRSVAVVGVEETITGVTADGTYFSSVRKAYAAITTY